MSWPICSRIASNSAAADAPYAVEICQEPSTVLLLLMLLLSMPIRQRLLRVGGIRRPLLVIHGAKGC